MNKSKIKKILRLYRIGALYIFISKSDIFSMKDIFNEDFPIDEGDSFFNFNENKNEDLDYNEKGGKFEYDDNKKYNDLCCAPIPSEEKNYNFEKYKDVVNDTNDKKNKKNIKFELQKNILDIKNPLLKKRKRRKKEDLTNGKEGNATRKKTRGRFKKTDLKALNYIPDVENYKDIRHSKFGIDNIISKIRTLILNEIVIFINEKISKYPIDKVFLLFNVASEEDVMKSVKKMYKEKKFLLKLSGSFKGITKTKDNIELLDQKIEEFLANDVAANYKCYKKDHNRNIIEMLKKSGELEEIFNLTFLDCVNHFCGIEKKEALNGFIEWKNYKNKLVERDGEKFTELFCDVLRNYKAVISKRFFRKNKTNVDSMDNINFELNDNSFENLLMENIYEKDF